MAEVKIALITGGNGAIGLAVAKGLGALGHKIVITVRSQDKADEALGELAAAGVQADAKILDVKDIGRIENVVEEIIAEHGRIDILVNNAGVLLEGISSRGGLDGVEPGMLRETFEINTLSAYAFIRAAAPHMKRQGHGRIVNISSILGQMAGMGAGWPAYSISKAALNAVTRVAAADLGGGDIKVNSAHPGWVASKLGGMSAPVPPEHGAEVILWLATLGPDGPTGGFFDGPGSQLDW